MFISTGSRGCHVGLVGLKFSTFLAVQGMSLLSAFNSVLVFARLFFLGLAHESHWRLFLSLLEGFRVSLSFHCSVVASLLFLRLPLLSWVGGSPLRSSKLKGLSWLFKFRFSPVFERFRFATLLTVWVCCSFSVLGLALKSWRFLGFFSDVFVYFSCNFLFCHSADGLGCATRFWDQRLALPITPSRLF